MAFTRSSTIEGPGRFRHIRFFHQILFCLNLTYFITWLILSREANTKVSWLDRLGYSAARCFGVGPQSWLAIRHERLFPLMISLLLWISLWSLCWLLTSALLKLLGQERFLLRSLSGFVAFCSAPAFWYYFGGWSFVASWKEIAAAEVAASVLIAFLFLTAGSWFPGWLMALLFTAHCIFWCWYFLNGFLINTVLIQPLVAFASGLTWVAYLLDRRPADEVIDRRRMEPTSR